MSASPKAIAVAVLLVAAVSTPLHAQQPVLSGLDLFTTDASGTDVGFGSGAPPIPADFFGPGSDPFVGTVGLQGDPLIASSLCPNDNLAAIDTIVRRNGDANFPGIPSTAPTVQIEIVELSLVSSQPIVVTYFGGSNPELWDVSVDLSQVPQPTGGLDASIVNPAGGVFDINLPVLPKFTFVRISDNFTVELDFGLAAIPPLVFSASGIPWQYSAPPPTSCTSNWCPASGAPMLLQAPGANHTVQAQCLSAAPVPALTEPAMIAMTLLLVASGALMRRHRRTASA